MNSSESTTDLQLVENKDEIQQEQTGDVKKDLQKIPKKKVQVDRIGRQCETKRGLVCYSCSQKEKFKAIAETEPTRIHSKDCTCFWCNLCVMEVARIGQGTKDMLIDKTSIPSEILVEAFNSEKLMQTAQEISQLDEHQAQMVYSLLDKLNFELVTFGFLKWGNFKKRITSEVPLYKINENSFETNQQFLNFTHVVSSSSALEYFNKKTGNNVEKLKFTPELIYFVFWLNEVCLARARRHEKFKEEIVNTKLNNFITEWVFWKAANCKDNLFKVIEQMLINS